eukprot:6212186-Pleurochrysis_carterae.AAC.3
MKESSGFSPTHVAVRGALQRISNASQGYAHSSLSAPSPSDPVPSFWKLLDGAEEQSLLCDKLLSRIVCTHPYATMPPPFARKARRRPA